MTSGLGGMSGAQPKAAKIAGITSITAEVNKNAIQKRYEQGWIDEIIDNISDLVKRIEYLKSNNKISSIGFLGNIVEIWEEFQKRNIFIDIASDQTSLHNPWSGGYYPISLSFDEANKMIKKNPNLFKSHVKKS